MLAGCFFAQAVLIASMIGPSWTVTSFLGSCGDWPCLAVMMIVVDPARSSARIWATILPSWALT